jgi:hypothetical protein
VQILPELVQILRARETPGHADDRDVEAGRGLIRLREIIHRYLPS